MKLQVVALLGSSLMIGFAAVADEEARPGFQLEAVGLRYGFGEGGLSRDFEELEGVAGFSLPWEWELGRGWELSPRLELSLGSFGNDHATAVIGSAGAMFSLAPGKVPVALDVGVGPTFLSEHEFVTRGVGSDFQIRSWFGLSWAPHDHVRLSYHFQHMSNGGLAGDNQGLNMHTFSIAWRF